MMTHKKKIEDKKIKGRGNIESPFVLVCTVMLYLRGS